MTSPSSPSGAATGTDDHPRLTERAWTVLGRFVYVTAHALCESLPMACRSLFAAALYFRPGSPDPAGKWQAGCRVATSRQRRTRLKTSQERTPRRPPRKDLGKNRMHDTQSQSRSHDEKLTSGRLTTAMTLRRLRCCCYGTRKANACRVTRGSVKTQTAGANVEL